MNQDLSLRSVVSDADTESRNEEASEVPTGIDRENQNNANQVPYRQGSLRSDLRNPHDDDSDGDADADDDADADAASSGDGDEGESYNDGIREDNSVRAPFPESLNLQVPQQLPIPQQRLLPQQLPIPQPQQFPGNQFQVNYPYSPYPPPLPMPLQPPVHPPPPQHMLQFYEAQMRDHAAAYASAAAAAAWAAAQIAADMANAGQATIQNPHIPRTLPVPPTAGMPEQYPTFFTSMGGPPGYNVMDTGPPYPPMMDPLAYSGFQPTDAAYNVNNYAHRRRKRQQRMPPSEPDNNYNNNNNSNSTVPTTTASTVSSSRQSRAPPPHPPVDETRGRRRRFCQDGSSDNASDSNYSQSHMGNSHPRRRTRIRKVMASSNSSDGGSGSAQFNKKKKPRQPNDDSLIGKTGVSALYEWCGKRRTNPIFSLVQSDTGDDSISNPGDLDHLRAEEEKRNRGDEFEMTVSIDGIEWGRGRARTKSAAKQEAARRALHALLPGVVFEEASGILVHLPNNTVTGGAISPSTSTATTAAISQSEAAAPWKASACLEDLAPNLAKRLAIRHAEDDTERETTTPRQNPNSITNESSKKRPSKWNGVYPCASTTTSDDDDENAYYASRGASVCSALLHAMVQIDDRIPEAPTYQYELATLPSTTLEEEDESGTFLQPKRKADAGNKVQSNSSRTPIQVHRGPFTCTATMRVRRTSQQGESASTDDFEILKAIGIGGAKREAKHTASAKLLALLFPECEGMAQVKQAAEAARERYAASKALKQQSKREWAFVSKIHRWHQSNEQTLNIAFALGSENKNPKLPSALEEHFLRGLGLNSSDGDTKPNHNESASNARQWSRQKQFDESIALALQKLNEHDEEGRSLPDQLTVDDVVGRTVLRRATTEDSTWISKLLDEPAPHLSPIAVLCPPTLSTVGEQGANDVSSPPIQLWSSSTIVLLLCRAISPYDDPPLGYAVLTVGFSLQKGRILRVAQIGSKPHLPRERFIECLQAFASCMKYSLETTSPDVVPSGKGASMITIRQNEIQCILRSHISTSAIGDLAFLSPSRIPKKQKNYGNLLQEEPLTETASTLQAVQEESEGVEESGAESSPEKRASKKNDDKPSKRSRVQ